jgi:hypothetical protein
MTVLCCAWLVDMKTARKLANIILLCRSSITVCSNRMYKGLRLSDQVCTHDVF